ncbi:MAG: hypothetical protein CVV56_05545 [Tenericutes bacterium HGW-Tenericutes-1]|nr:MAG: hypothetical protein CVV56_05545 [Tenericutes bacterium HGW-Tenericutes-1]
MKNRMLMSILALVGASLLLVGATLAWFTVSTTVNNDNIDLALINVDATVALEMYVIDTWVTTDSINISASEPGDSYQYRLVIYNSGNVGLTTDIILSDFVDGLTNPLGYQNELSLLNALTISATNSVNTTYEITTMTLSSAIGQSSNFYTPNLMLADNVSLAIGETGYVYFTLSLPGTVGNDYRNLTLGIQQIRITLASE